MNNINELYNLWLEKATADPDLKKELLGIKGNDDEDSVIGSPFQ